MKRSILYVCCLSLCYFMLCPDDESTNYVLESKGLLADEIDAYFQEDSQEKYDSTIRWQWIDKYVDTNYVVMPVVHKVLIPTGEMIRRFQIEPLILESKTSGEFIRKYFLPETVCVDSGLRNADGTCTLGYADTGVRTALTELSYFDPTNREWVIQQLHTMHHEFPHITHQTYKMPNGFNKITEDIYTGQAWKDINTNTQAELIGRGISSSTTHEIDSVAQSMTIQRRTPALCGTSSESEDFIEPTSFYLLAEPAVFGEIYIASDSKRTFLDKDKADINEKLALMKEYYMSNFSIDLAHLREVILQRLNEISTK